MHNCPLQKSKTCSDNHKAKNSAKKQAGMLWNVYILKYLEYSHWKKKMQAVLYIGDSRLLIDGALSIYGCVYAQLFGAKISVSQTWLVQNTIASGLIFL